MLHLHHLEKSRSIRILWLLEELELPYQLTTYERTSSYLAPKRLEEIDPMGKAPILVIEGNADGEMTADVTATERKVLTESGFIIEYLLRHYDNDKRLKPVSDETAWENYTFWLHFAEASAMPPLVMRLVFNKVVERSPALIRPISKRIQEQVERGMIAGNINKALELMENHLRHNQWFAGENFSAADIQMHFVVAAANGRPSLDNSKYNNLLNWLKRCESRAAFERALAKGGR